MAGQERIRRGGFGLTGQAKRPDRRELSGDAKDARLLSVESIIQLQRSHGNRVVLELLDSQRAWNVQRDKSALEKNTSAAERGKLQVARGGVPLFSKQELEAAFNDKASPWVDDVEFGGGIDAGLHAGLQNVAQSVFHQESHAYNTVSNVPLDLTHFGGANGVYRFTVIKRGTTPKTRLIIELVSSQPPAQLTTQELEAEKKRFQMYEFKLGTDFAGEEAQKMLYSALARVPNAVLEHVRGLTFSRKLQAAGDRGEPGHYDPNTHTIEVYAAALVSYANSADASGAEWLTFALMHEIGHAADYESFIVARRKRDALAAQLKEAQLDAKRVDPNAGLGKDAEAAQRVKDARVGQLQTQLNAAQAAFDAAVGGLDLAAGGSRSQSSAFKDAEGKPISEYGATANLENFAEDFAVFVLDPELLKSLRPAAHAYFVKNFK